MVGTSRVSVFLFSASIVAGFATPASAAKFFTASKEKVFAEQSNSEALIYVVRPATFGFGIKLWVFSDDTPIGVTKGKMYCMGTVAPGKHVFWTKGENISSLELNVEAGKTYYLKQKIKTGVLKARVGLQVISKEEWEKDIKKCDYAKLTSEGEKRGLEIAAKGLAKAQEKAEKRSE